MTQQPFYPQAPGQPQYPAQQYPQPTYPQQPPAQQYAPQQQMPQQPQQPPAVPLAQGSLDDFYNQPSAASGPSISWTDAQGSPKPIGTTYQAVVARDVTNADVQQQTDFNTKQPLFYRDGRPKFAMKVPLRLQPSTEFPEGEGTWYVKGQARDELVRAMSAAGVTGSPKAGAVLTITLVQRRPSGRGLNPANVVQVQYQPGNAQGAPVAPSQPVQPQQAQPVQRQYPQQPQPAPVQQVAQMPVQPSGQPVGQPQVEQQPVQQVLAMPQGHDWNADQQALMAKLTGQAQQGAPA